MITDFSVEQIVVAASDFAATRASDVSDWPQCMTILRGTPGIIAKIPPGNGQLFVVEFEAYLSGETRTFRAEVFESQFSPM